MATQSSFDAVLKKYMPYELLKEEIIKRDYFLQRVEKDQNWKGGDMEIVFKGGSARSFRSGGIVSQAKIGENIYVKGSVPKYKEIWGAMVFNDSDLQSHGDMAQSFLKILPEQLEDFIMDMKEAVSVALLNNGAIDALDVANAGTALLTGVVGVARPERFTVGQYLELGIVGTLRFSGYVKSIDMGNKLLTITTDKARLLLADLSAAGVILGDSAYYEGGTVSAGRFTSLAEQLLMPANGGAASIFGVAKGLYPHLQAGQFDATARGMSATNILDKLFDFITETRTVGKGNPTEIIMSGKNFAVAVAGLTKTVQSRDPALATSSSNFNVVAQGNGATFNAFGWSEITIGSAQGSVKLVGINEMDDDKMYIMDWNALKLHSNGFFERRTSPEGKQFFESRVDGQGFNYIVDIRFFGELIVSKPSHCGVIFNVPAL